MNTKPKIIEYMNTKDNSVYSNSALPMDKPIFEPIPPVIMFSDFEALKIKSKVLKLRNLDSVTRRVKIVQPETNLFKIVPLTTGNSESNYNSGNKVAPGLEISFLIKFSPETKTDYKYELTIITEREKFIIPIIAIGKKSLIDFPDLINFGNSCPVKYFTEKPVIIHNKGEKTTKWEIRLPDDFEASKKEGVLDEGRTEQIVLQFYPKQRKYYHSIGRLLYDGEEAEFELKGNAINGNVYLSKAHLQMEETYISLENRETFKIINKSSVKINFEWRAFSSESEENDKKKLLLDQLEKEEINKKVLIYETLDLEDNFKTLTNDSNDEEMFEELDEKELLLKKRKKAEMLLDRKYKAIRKAVEEEVLIFEDDIFTITPTRGSIWPNSEMTVTITFKPKSALKYNHKAYCNISCSDERLPIFLEGEGLGPKAFLSTNNLSVGDIFVNETQNFSIYIENKGEIPARFSLINNNTSFSKMIDFDIKEAELAVGQRMNILMSFKSSKVGEFQELFKWCLEGSSEILTLLIRGHVRAPKFEFNRKMIDYKKVSFRFQKTEEIVLTNTSTVPFIFGLRIPQDGKGNNKEFELVPEKDEIQPNESKKIKINFIPHFRKFYKVVMVLDIENIGKDIKSIPIVAESCVPKVKIMPDVLDFGDIYLRYPQTKEIELINESNLPARYIVHPINPKFSSLGSVKAYLDKGQIAPESNQKVNITLTTCCIKAFEMDLIVEIISDTNTQHLIKIKANSRGPDVELSHKDLDFGEVEVLNKSTQKIVIKNKSVIEADFYAFTKNKNSIFKPIQKHYILKPEQSFEVDVVCVADDAQRFHDTLYFVIKEGVDKEVQLRAKGVGSTIFCKDIKYMNFGTLYTHKNMIQEVFLENKGRKTQTLRWQRKYDKGEINNEGDSTNVYSVYPESVVLLPKTGLMFQFKAYSTHPGKISEVYTLSSAIGTERKNNILFNTKMEGEFLVPSLNFSKKNTNFKYIWKKDVEPAVISQKLQITCPGPLPTNFSLYVEAPFSINPNTFSLLPKKSCTVKIDFNPKLRKQKISGKISEKLHIKHLKHPKNESYDLTAEYCYPNMKFSSNSINFGAVMNDTSKKKYIVMTNISEIPCEYSWHFVDEGNKYDIPLNEVFDILPLRGTLEPKIDEKIEFSYYAVPFKNYHLTAVCKVIGGPDYFVKLTAEASDVAYSLIFPKNKNFLDAGETYLNHKITRDFEIENTSKVMFDYSLRLDTTGNRSNYMKEFIKIIPSKGSLMGGEKARIKITITPIFPDEIIEHIIIQVAHFEPEKISMRINGILPSLRVLLPKKQDNNVIKFFPKNSKFNYQSVEFWESFSDNISDKQLYAIEKTIINSYLRENFSRVLTMKHSTSMTNRKTPGGRGSQSEFTSSQMNLSRSVHSRSHYRFLDDINMGTYILDLGTIVAGTKVLKVISIKNIGNSPISFDIDIRNFKSMGLTFSTTKVSKLSNTNNSETQITVCFQTKKTFKSGKTFFLIPINVADGCKYFLEILANVNVPELVLSKTSMDFGNVIIGQSKKMFLRIANQKQISCVWSIQRLHGKYNRKKKDTPSVTIQVMEGVLDSGKHKTIELVFQPGKEGEVKERFVFQFKDSNRKIDFMCSGKGILPNLIFSPDDIQFQSCLPGETTFKALAITNESDFNVNLISTDLDQQFIEESNLLLNYSKELAKLPIRRYNEPFWPIVKEEITVKLSNKEIAKEIEAVKQDEEMEPEEKKVKILELKSKICYINNSNDDVLPIEFGLQYNLLLFSEDDSLINRVSKFIESEYKKTVVDLEQLINWHETHNTELNGKIQEYMTVKREELEVLLEEQRKKKKKKGEPLDEEGFLYLPLDILKEAIEIRLKHEDCKAGVVIINTNNTNSQFKESLEVLVEFYKESNLCIFNISDKQLEFEIEEQPEKEEEEEETIKNLISPIVKTVEYTEEGKKNFKDFVDQRLKSRKIGSEQKELIYLNMEREDEFTVEEKPSFVPLLNDIMNEKGVDNVKFDFFHVLFPKNIIKMNYLILKEINPPVFPNKETLPIPQPICQQIVNRPVENREIKQLNNFELFSYKDIYGENINEEEISLTVDNYLEYVDVGLTRWVIPPKKTIYLCFKYSSDTIISFNEKLNFQASSNIFNDLFQGWSLKLEAKTVYPDFNRNFVNIFSSRRKTKKLQKSKSFIMNEKIFDYGPLLIVDKNKFEENRKIYKKNLTVLRFSNNSAFTIKIHFEFREQIVEGEEEEPKKNNAKGKKGGKNDVEQIFELEVNEVELKIDETFELKIWAVPDKEGEFLRELVCNVENNPNPMIIPFNCIGIKPNIKVDTDVLNFEKLILSKNATKEFEVKNVCQIPVKWNIANLEEVEGNSLTVEPNCGVLEPNQTQSVTTTFSAVKEAKISTSIKIQAEDNDGIGLLADEMKNIDVVAEGYEISVDFKELNDEKNMIVDFGNTQVRKSVNQTFIIKNNGIYPIDFELLFLKKKVSKFFTVEPESFNLDAGKEQVINLKFTPQNEVLFDVRNKATLNVRILEKQTNEVFNEVKISLNAQSQYSKFIINPSKQLNFGPIRFSETRKRSFEITNNGYFAFNYYFYDYSNVEMRQTILEEFNEMLEEEPKGGKGKNPPKKNKPNSDKLELGEFLIEPANGNVEPGETIVVDVTFNGNGNNWYETQLGVEIFNQNLENLESGLFYSLVGESCIPCIDINNFRQIFEEQVVTESLNSTGINIQDIVEGNFFSIEDNAFYFGNIIPSKYPNGITEKFKLINKGKVSAQIECNIKNKNDSLFAFEVFPKTLKINPHESAYIKIKFFPDIMAVYEAIFEAKVINGDDTLEGCMFTFDVKGEGTLPTLKVLDMNLSISEPPTIDFGKIRNDRIKRKCIAIKNTGLIPATAVVRLQRAKNFRLISSAERVIMPQETYSFELEFRPNEIIEYKDIIELKTLLNPYEFSEINIRGEGFYDDVYFEGLENEDDVLDFGDLMLIPEDGKIAKKHFYIRNNSLKTIRFEWADLDSEFDWIIVKPKIGHVSLNMSKKITVRILKPEMKSKIDLKQILSIKIQKIQLAIDTKLFKIRNWDNEKRVKKIITEKEFEWMEEVKRIEEEFNKNQKGNKQNQPQLPKKPEILETDLKNKEVFENVAEPEFELLEADPKEISLNLQGKIDIPNIKCEINKIYFKETEMLTVCAFNFQVDNLSSIDLNYRWSFYDEYTSSSDPGYFEIHPQAGQLKKNNVTEFIVKFFPTECDIYSIKRYLFMNILGSDIEHKLMVSGLVRRPICHFELPFRISDFGDKIIEIESLGYQNTTLNKFYVLNPTSLSYDFYWNTEHVQNSFIKCLTPKGSILSGKKFEMMFEFSPNNNCLDHLEKNFNFVIPKHNLTQSFIVKASILQPKIFFNKSKIDFGPLLLAGKSKDTVYLKNLDNMPYSFNFLKSSIRGSSPSQYGSLMVSPLSGEIAAGSTVPIKVNFQPKVETDYNYNLVCNIKGKKEALTLNVKGTGYKLRHQITYKDKVLTPQYKQPIHFGNIFVKDFRVQAVTLVNNGDFNFDFTIDRKPSDSLMIHPENGTVKKNEKVNIEFHFQPMKPAKISSTVKLMIISGPMYKFEVKGHAIYPRLEIKPSKINFNNILVTNSPVTITKELQIINNDDKTLTVECDFPACDYLDIKLPPGLSVLPHNNNPKNIISVPIVLNLRKIGKFNQNANFVINGSYDIKCNIKGEGVPLSIELENPQDINSDFGTLKPHQNVSKQIKILNHSKVPINMNFDINKQLANFFHYGLIINPSSVYIPSKSNETLEIRFNPKQRLTNFNHQLQYDLKESDQQFNLLNIKGACFGIEIKIIDDCIDFGSVVVNSALTKKLQMMNLGDVNCEFSWDEGSFGEFFKITPQKGIISSNEQLYFDISFKPKTLKDQKVNAKLKVKHLPEVLKVKLLGIGIDLPSESIKEVQFETEVRETIEKTVEINNPTSEVWELLPSINNDNYKGSYFKVGSDLIIPAKSKKTLKIEYTPLTMLPKPHKATLFLPLKNGTALNYKLIGTALDPKPMEIIELKTKAKVALNHSISLFNWLNIQQRLRTIISMEDDQQPLDKGLIVNASSIIDVSPSTNYNFKLSFFALKKGDYTLRVQFKNDKLKDYVFYIIKLEVEDSPVLEKIQLSSTIRESSFQSILIDNPLNKPITIAKENIEFDSQDLLIKTKLPLKLKPNSKGTLEIKYRPLILYKEKTTSFLIKTEELGDSKYEIILNSNKSSNIPTLYFKGKIGDISYKPFNFTSYAFKSLSYTCEINKLTSYNESNTGSSDFILESQNYTAQAALNDKGANCTFNIKYEPSILGVSKGLLSVKNSEGGEYQAYLIGTSEFPLPKGPYKISPKGFSLDFKNPFNETREFSVKVDNDCFSCGVKSPLKLEGKKVAKITVTYKENENNKGRLIIKTENNISWIYYLHGVNN